MAFDAFLEIDGIPGESTDSAHTDWVEVIDYKHMMYQKLADTASSAGAMAGERATHGTFIVTKDLDKTSPKLAVNLNSGASIATVTMEVCRATGDKQCYMVYKLEDCIVSKIEVTGNTVTPGDTEGTTARTVPTEVVEFAYSKITWTYTVTDKKTGAAAGNVEGNWDRSENKGG